MTTVELGPVRALCVCGHPYGDHTRYAHGCCTSVSHDCECDHYTPQQDWPPNVQRAMVGLSPEAQESLARVLRGEPRRRLTIEPVAMLDDVRNIIAARRQECYGALKITDDQIDELARAVTQRFTLEDR